MDKESEALSEFGAVLVRRVRDKAILDWEKIIDGRLKGRTAESMRPKLASFTEAQRQVLADLVPRIVDTTLHHLLWTLEQVDWVRVEVETEAGTVSDLARVSENFPGELYTEEGWIARFTEQRHDADF